MVRRILQSLGVGRNTLVAHEKERPRRDAYLGGVTDPTFAIPEGQVFIPGLQSHVPLVDGVRCVFVSRCPCIEPKDGKLLTVLSERPSDMSGEDWDALQARPFGEIIFSGKGQAIPETIAAGDLDGDRYIVCWNPDVVSEVRPAEEEPAMPTAKAVKGPQTGPNPKPKRPETSPTAWLERAQEHMLKPETLHEGHLIGRLYNAAEKVADESELGIRDPDARALYQAYAQAIDQGKHGGEVAIPEHLRIRFRL